MVALGWEVNVQPAKDRNILTVIRELSFARDIDEVKAVIRSYARALVNSDGVTFVLKDGDQCWYCEEDAIAPLWKGKKFPLSACISGWVMINKQPAAIENIYSDPRIAIDAYRQTFVKSLTMVPVRREDPVAAIGAYWARTHNATQDEMAILGFLADSAALAMRNVKLYGELNQALAVEQQARQQAEEACRAKDRWIALLSHELRTPLTPIIGWVDILKLSDDPSKIKMGVEAIDRNAKGLSRVIEDLIDASHIMSGKLELDRGPFDLANLVQLVLTALREYAVSKGVAVTPDIIQSCAVAGDPRRLHQVVYNLVHNAIKFTPEGGTVDVSLVREPSSAHLIIRDTGSGIEPETLERIFRRFEVGDSSSTRAAGGLGLGLWIARCLVEAHTGILEAESEGKDRGTTFRVRLPLATAPAVSEN
jgi:two-component system CheB/CheR fusion protein